MSKPLTIAFAGSHPDDIELGSGALLHRLVTAGHDVWALILTDDGGEAFRRREEAQRALKELGLDSSRVLFGGFPDGYLQVNRDTVGSLRKMAEEACLDPRIVITHTAADSHNDHVAANGLLRAAFRKAAHLLYSIHLSAESSRFNPRFYVSVTDELATLKEASLRQHASQLARIERTDLKTYEEGLGSWVNIPRAEAFEIQFQAGAESALTLLADYNDSPFLKLWGPIIGDDLLHLFYEAFTGNPPSIAEYTRHHESCGRDSLREAFSRHWQPCMPLREHYSNIPNAELILADSHVLLAGGPVNNTITREHFNRWQAVSWIVDYDMPHREPVYVLHKPTGRRYHPRRDDAGALLSDVAVLTFCRNPMDTAKWVVSCAGVHGLGTQGLLTFLADPGRNPELLAHIVGSGECQIPLRVDASTLALTHLEDAP